MRLSEHWQDYELLDTSSGERLERWGDIILIRPDPQIIWTTEKKNPLWRSAHARYHRSNKGGGYWETYKKVPDRWTIGYRELTFNIKPMGFKHTGVFPEQAVNWDFAAEKIRQANRPLRGMLKLKLLRKTIKDLGPEKVPVVGLEAGTTLSGQPLRQGTYVYHARVSHADGTVQSYRGTLTLIR